MKNSIRIWAILLITPFVFAAAGNSEYSWKCIYKKDDISVYSRKVAGSSYNEFKVSAEISATLETIVAVLSDVPAATQWIENIEEARVIKTVDTATSIVYLSIDLPWPLASRDVVTRSSGEFIPETVTLIIRSNAIHDPDIPLKNGYIRIMDLKSEWSLIPRENDRAKTLVEYTAHSNPEGYIPAFLVNLTLKNQMHHTMTGLKRMVQNPAYISAGQTSEFKMFLDKVLEKK